jgi:hypothetical protein
MFLTLFDYYATTTPFTCGLVVSIQNILVPIPTVAINIKNDSNKKTVRIMTTISLKMGVEPTPETLCISNLPPPMDKVVEFNDAL